MNFFRFILRAAFTSIFILLVFRFFLWIVAPTAEQANDPFAIQVYSIVSPVLPMMDSLLWLVMLPVTALQSVVGLLLPTLKVAWFPSISVIDFCIELRLFGERLVPGFSDMDVSQELADINFPGIIHWNYLLALVFWVAVEQLAEIIVRGGSNTVREIQHRLKVYQMEQGHQAEQRRIESFRQKQEEAYRQEQEQKRVTAESLVRPVVDALKEESSTLQQRINRDALTGLYNHGFFTSHLGKQLANARHYQQTLALILVDLDHFKAVNDTYGHPFGDQVLKNTGTAIQTVIRPIQDRAVACRQGGEEMSVILSNTNPQEAQGIAESIRQKISEIAFISNPEVSVTASLGLLCLVHTQTNSTNGVDRDWLVKQADQLLYTAKQKGRNRVEATVFS